MSQACNVLGAQMESPDHSTYEKDQEHIQGYQRTLGSHQYLRGESCLILYKYVFMMLAILLVCLPISSDTTFPRGSRFLTKASRIANNT